MWILLSVFLLVPCVRTGVSESAYNLDLSGEKEWTVTNVNQTSRSIHIHGTVPGGIYSDLIAANVIPADIFFRFNDVALRWVAYENWVYSRNFTLTQEDLTKQHHLLSFLGVDTVASIFLNGQFLGNTTNMFVAYDFDVKPYLKLQNSLTIHIYSPIREALRVSQSLPHNSPPECTPTVYHGECHVNVLRKMQASFAWDWGPAFPSMGIWKPVLLRFFDNLLLDHVTTTLQELPHGWNVVMHAHINTTLNASQLSTDVTMHAKMPNEDGNVRTGESSFEVIKNEDGIALKKTMLVMKNLVNLWWPNGYGSQPLYNLTVTLVCTFPNADRLVLNKTVTIGFRTVRIVQDPVGKNQGLTFYFLINNVPIFAKGSNYIPGHILPEKSADYATVNRLLYSAAQANMNMLRVWGGGLYESELFYDLCDRYGILVWQDFMFACATYPTTGDFLNSVAVEIAQQVRRLMNHPCIAVWAGNNENEVALRQNWYSTSNNESLYFAEYRKLYVGVIRDVVTRVDPSREYLTSSPSNGKQSVKENFIAENPYDPLYGDTHTYNYFINPWNPSNYPVPRFCSEYGFQSLPSRASLAPVSAPGDLANLGTPFMGHRQHLPAGNLYLVSLLKHQIDLPPSGTEDLDTFIYYTQINQAWSIKTETELYRRHRSILNKDGTGLTMGALYWQLNDVWQAPSWSSIEFSGRWKMLHFWAAKFFAPLLISPTLKFPTNNLTLTLVNDLETGVDHVILHVYFYTWNSTSPLKHVTKPYSVKKACSEVTWTMPLVDLSGSHTPDEVFIRAGVTDPAGIPLIHDNFLFPTTLKKAAKHMTPTAVTVHSIKETAPDNYEIHIYSEHIALFVWIEIQHLDTVNETSIYFSDNGFHMVSQDHIIACTIPNVTSSILKDHIRIQVFNKLH